MIDIVFSAIRCGVFAYSVVVLFWLFSLEDIKKKTTFVAA